LQPSPQTEEITRTNIVNIIPITLYPGNTMIIQPAGTNARITITVPLDENPTCEIESDRICELFVFDSELVVQPVEELDQS